MRAFYFEKEFLFTFVPYPIMSIKLVHIQQYFKKIRALV